MATSDTYDFNPAVVQIITQVLRDLDVINEEETPNASQYAEGVFKLNGIVKGLETQTIHVWTEEEAILFLQPFQPRYTLGSGGTNAQCAAADQWTLMQLAGSYIAAVTDITVEAPNGANALQEQELEDILAAATGYKIGIVLDTGFTFWTTIAAVAGFDLTLTDALPSSASAGNLAFIYPAAAEIVRPLKIPRTRLLTFASYNETPMTVLSRQEYMDLPNKLSPGTPTQSFYTPQRDLGYLYVWPVPITTAWAIRFTWYRPLQDLLLPGNTMDFPQEWTLPLQWMLANEWRLGFSIPRDRADQIREQAALWYEAVSGWDRESEPIQFGMDYQFR